MKRVGEGLKVLFQHPVIGQTKLVALVVVWLEVAHLLVSIQRDVPQIRVWKAYGVGAMHDAIKQICHQEAVDIDI